MKKKIITAVNNGIINAFLKNRCKSLCDVILNNITSQDELLDTIKRFKADVIIIDDRMQGSMDGMTFLREIRKISAASRIVLVTACDDKQYSNELMKNGVYDIFVDTSSDISALANMLFGENPENSGKKDTKSRKLFSWDNNIEENIAYILPENYKSAAGFTGAHGTGKTFLACAAASALANKGKKVVLIDMTENKTLEKCFCQKHEDTAGRKNIPEISENIINIEKNLSIYTYMNKKNLKAGYADILEKIFENWDIAIFDMDRFSPLEQYKYMKDIFMVQDMEYGSVVENRDILAKMRGGGINMKKISLVINKYIEGIIDIEDMKKWVSAGQKSGDPLLADSSLARIDFRLHDHIADIQSRFEGRFEPGKFTQEFRDDVDLIIRKIYPYMGVKHRSWIDKIIRHS